MRAGPYGAKRDQRLGLAFRDNRLACLVLDDIACKPLGQLADDDFAGFGPLLQSGGDIDGVAAHHELAILTGSGQGLAGVDSHSHG